MYSVNTFNSMVRIIKIDVYKKLLNELKYARLLLRISKSYDIILSN